MGLLLTRIQQQIKKLLRKNAKAIPSEIVLVECIKHCQNIPFVRVDVRIRTDVRGDVRIRTDVRGDVRIRTALECFL